MNDAIEIKIVSKNGRRMALYRRQGGISQFWHYMPVRQAEKALREGVVSVGLAENAPAVAAASVRGFASLEAAIAAASA